MTAIMSIAFTFAIYFTDFGPRWTAILPIPICLLMPFAHVYWTLRLIKSNPAVLSKTTIEFDEDGLSVKNDVGSSKLQWNSFVKSADLKNYFGGALKN